MQSTRPGAAPEGDLAGMSLAERKYLEEEGSFLFSGVQAIVRMILDKHRRDRREGRAENATFISGYEGSPLGGLDLELARAAHLFPRVGRIVHQPGVNEKLAMAGVYGSQFAGNVDGFWYGKAQGVKWIPDEGGLAAFSGTGHESGAVILAGDDHQSKSSTFPGSSDLMLEDMFAPILFPSTIDEIIYLGLAAVELSRYSGLYVGLKLLTPLCDGLASVRVSPERERLTTPEPHHRKVFRHAILAKPSLAIEREIVEERLEAALHFARANQLNTTIDYTGPQERRLGFVVAGKAYTDLLLALCDIGTSATEDPIRILKLGMSWPVDPEIVREFADGLSEIVVIEEKRDFIERQVKSILHGRTDARVWGKRGREDELLLPAWGEITPETIVERLAPILEDYLQGERPFLERRQRELSSVAAQGCPSEVPSRVPTYCSGCPHARSLKLPEGSRAGGDIGCHTMEITKTGEGRGIEWISAMGAGGAINNGLFPFRDNRHIFQNLGDGTYFHSGKLAIASSVASGANITYRILYNQVVAMTGGQLPQGQLAIPALVRELQSIGAKRVVVVSDEERRGQGFEVVPRAGYLRLLEEIRGVEGTSAIIYDQYCATEARRVRARAGALRERFLVVNPEVCEGCGDCGRSLCPSLHVIETELGPKTRIHQSSCNDDEHCLIGDCPAFTEVRPRSRPEGGIDRLAALARQARIPEPELGEGPVGNYCVFIAGIGGTGVVSLASVLAQAVLLDGGFVTALNMTGLAQKGGPVESQIILNRTEQPIINTIGYRNADLYISADSLHGLSAESLRFVCPERTRVVANLTAVPTIEMITDRRMPVPSPRSLREDWTRIAGEHRLAAMEAGAIVETLTANHMYVNVFLLGVAFQLGCVPISIESLEGAVRAGLRRAEDNLAVFELGRLWVHDRERVDGLLAEELERRGGGILERSAARRAGELERAPAWLQGLFGELEGFRERYADLIEYGDQALADRFAGLVRRTFEADPGPEHRLALAVSRGFYKLLAYKDEYEVARLHLFRMGHPSMDRLHGAGAGLAVYLHPPILRGLLFKRKIRVPGRIARGLFKLLAPWKRLRGGFLDPFGGTRARQLERGLIDWYEEALGARLEGLDRAGLEETLELARIPEGIRGFEEVKARTVMETGNAELLALLGDCSYRELADGV